MAEFVVKRFRKPKGDPVDFPTVPSRWNDCNVRDGYKPCPSGVQQMLMGTAPRDEPALKRKFAGRDNAVEDAPIDAPRMACKSKLPSFQHLHVADDASVVFEGLGSLPGPALESTNAGSAPAGMASKWLTGLQQPNELRLYNMSSLQVLRCQVW